MTRTRSRAPLAVVAVLAFASIGFGCVVKKDPGPAPAPPAATTAEPAPTVAAPPPTMTCDDFCNKINSVPGCATDPAQIPACASLCKTLQQGACKSKEEAAILCVAGANLKCNGSKVDLGACEAQAKDADDCFKTLPPK